MYMRMRQYLCKHIWTNKQYHFGYVRGSYFVEQTCTKCGKSKRVNDISPSNIKLFRRKSTFSPRRNYTQI